MLKKYGIIFLLTFVNALSFTILIPVLPFVVKMYNQPEIVLWILFATYSLFQFLAAPLLWALSDKYGRKPILILTQFGTFMSWIVLWIAYILPDTQIFWYILLPILVIFISRVFDGITGGNMSVAQAMIADITEKKDRSKIFWTNGAVFGFSLVIGPAIGSLSLSLSLGFLGSAIIGWVISIITLWIMFFFLQESLTEDNRKKEAIINLKSLNIWTNVKKWATIPLIKYTLVMRLFIFTAFITYTTISALYLIDVFWFSADKVGYYLTFTGTFLIFHQAVSIRVLVQKFGDMSSLLIGILCIAFGYMWMWLAGDNIIIFTIIYFFGVLGISACLTTLWALTSNAVDEKNQWEVLGMMTWVESMISILAPITATLLYGMIDFSIYFVVSALAFIAFIVSRVFFKDIQEKNLS